MKNIPIRQLHTSPTEPDLQEDFVIRKVQDLLKGKDMVQELHRHDHYHILILEKGSGYHEIDFNKYVISNYCVFFIRPGQVHQLTLHADGQGYLIQMTKDFYYFKNSVDFDTPQNLLSKAFHDVYYQLDVDRFKKTTLLYTYMFNEYSQKEEGYKKVIQSQLEVLFIELLRHSKYSISEDFKKPYEQEYLDNFLVFVREYIYTEKKVSFYSENLNITSYQLNAITKGLLGKTSSEVINDHIILEAKRYILATSNQVSQIANHLGYEDVSYFIRFFKKHTGYTPEAFRNNYR